MIDPDIQPLINPTPPSQLHPVLEEEEEKQNKGRLTKKQQKELEQKILEVKSDDQKSQWEKGIDLVQKLDLRKGKTYMLFFPEEIADTYTFRGIADALGEMGIKNIVVLVKDTKGIRVIEATEEKKK